MYKKYIYISIICLFVSNVALSQTDNTFWFVAPDITSGHGASGIYDGGEPIYLRMSSVQNPVTVTISQPADTAFTPIVRNIGALQTITVDLTNFSNDIENFPYNSINDKGLLIESSGGDITAYYEVGTFYNPDIFALKGDNALGREFYVPTQTVWTNGASNYNPDPYNEIHVVATEDNTTIRITPSANAKGHSANTPFTITLDRGQTYNLRADQFGGGDHLAGTKIEVISGGEIAVTISDDSVNKKDPGNCYDLNGDQVIPIDLIGQEYLVMKGEVFSNERVFVLAVEDNTEVYINNTLKTTLIEGATYDHILNQNATSIYTSKPAYVYHLAGFGCEMGGAVLPTIEGCTGSNRVSFIRTEDRAFFLNLMVRNGGRYGFKMHYEDGSTFTIPWDWFEQDTISGWWTLENAHEEFDNARDGGVPVDEVTTITNDEKFHLGTINGGDNSGCYYGYFSDYSENRGNAEAVETESDIIARCFGDSILLKADGGNAYEWNPQVHLNDPYIATPIATPPPGIHEYTVTIQRSCWPDTNIKITVQVFPEVIADFSIDKITGCAPLGVTMTDQSTGATEYNWDFENDGTFDANDSTFVRPPSYTNVSDSAIVISTRLLVSYNGECPDDRVRDIVVYPEINADFIASGTIGCQPFPVDFTNLSSGDTASFDWDFGDGATSTLYQPLHTYQNLGRADSIYRVQLIAESPFYCRDTAWQDILVHPYIDVKFAIDTINSCSPFPVQINNASNGVDTFHISFGDGNDTVIAGGFNILRYNYINSDNIPQQYTITMIGENSDVCFDTLSRTVTVYPEVDANFNINPANGCDSTVIIFNNTSTGPIDNYYWDFGDGSSSRSANPSHMYLNKTDSTVYDTAMLVVESEYLCRDTHQVVIPIYPYINADFAVDTVFGCHPFNLQIHNQSIGVDSYTWSFGDGSPNYTGSDSVFTHVYENTSFTNDVSYILSLTVSNTSGCTDTLTRKITVYHDIRADFDVDKYESCAPANFTFTSNSQGAANYLWNFGDGATSVKSNTTTHLYEHNLDDTTKIYPVSLFVTSENNACADFVDTTVAVHPYIKAEFSVEEYINCHPFTNTFENSSVGQNDTYQWYVDSVQIATAPSNKSPFVDTFTNTSGSIIQYEIRLEAENTQNCVSSYTDTIAVYPNVSSDFSILPDTVGCHPLNIQFVNNSTNASSSFWSFGDETTSSKNNPQHLFYNYTSDDTTYTIKLRSSSNQCLDSIEKGITVLAAPEAIFELDKYMGCSPLNVTVTNNSSTASSYTFDFDDGNVETFNTKQPIIHSYVNDTSINQSYNISLIVNNVNCSDTITRKLVVHPQVYARFEPLDTSGCNPFEIKFRNNSVNSHFYEWDFGDGFSSESKEPKYVFIVENNYSNSVYNVKLTAKSRYDCLDDTSATVTVYPSPDVTFSIDQPLQRYPDTIVTLNNETEDGLWTYHWDFGDGTESTQKNPGTHVYNTWGTYNIVLSAFVPNCTDKDTVTMLLEPPLPIADFIHSGNACTPNRVQFTNQSIYGVSYLWNFGDGKTSTVENPVHTYEVAGRYDVKLIVTGHDSSDHKERLIESYINPVINFSINPDTVMLPNGRITTSNNTMYADRYLWDFGDGDTSSLRVPEHIYGPPSDTSYTITLTAWSENNCIGVDSIPNAVRVEAVGVLEFPNVFIPSKSGPWGGYLNMIDEDDREVTNMVFRPAKKNVVDYHLIIYNRWGELVFETRDMNQGWDGYYQGELCSQGVYIWKAEGKFIDGTPFKKMGDVLLLID